MDEDQLAEEVSGLRQLKKPPEFVRLAVCLIGTLLELPSRFRNPQTSHDWLYQVTMEFLEDNAGSIGAHVDAVEASSVSIASADSMYSILHHASWDIGLLFARGWPTLGELAQRASVIFGQLSRLEGRKPVCAAHVVVAVDGSRMSYTAFDVAASIRGHGRLSVVHVTDPSKDYLPPHLRPRYLETDFQTRCMQCGIPETRYAVHVVPKPPNRRTRTVLEEKVQSLKPDVVVMGAFGRKGPSIFATGTVTDFSVRSLPCTTIIVKPTSVVLQPSQPALFVVAVDHSEVARGAFQTALLLMRPIDILTVLHIRIENPENPEDTASDELVDTYERMLELALVSGEVVLEDKMRGKTVAQQICSFVEDRGAAFLAMGVDGMSAYVRGDRWVGSVSDACANGARCTTIICKDTPPDSQDYRGHGGVW